MNSSYVTDVMMFGIKLKNKKTNLLNAITIFFLIVFDQFSKYLIENNFNLYESYELIRFLNITFIVNYGFAFGIFNDPNSSQVLIMIIIMIIIIYLIFLLIQTKSTIIKISFILILSGAIGNFIDRLLRGYVIDFIDLYISNYHWPAFNFADSYISIGFIIIMITILSGKKI